MIPSNIQSCTKDSIQSLKKPSVPTYLKRQLPPPASCLTHHRAKRKFKLKVAFENVEHSRLHSSLALFPRNANEMQINKQLQDSSKSRHSNRNGPFCRDEFSYRLDIVNADFVQESRTGFSDPVQCNPDQEQLKNGDLKIC